MLIDELNHRVKNTLATVQSIVTQAVRNSSDPQIVRESIETRIAALSRSHDLLGREKWQGAGLHDLVVQMLEPFGVADGHAERFTIEGENIRLSPKAALALGIAFHELATNAVKYGAFSNKTGTISIKWMIEDQARWPVASLHWREKDGPPVTPPTRKGSDRGCSNRAWLTNSMARSISIIGRMGSFAQSTCPRHERCSMDDQLLSGRRVLVVEDEMLILMAIEDMLADLGCTSIAAAATIERALALIEAEPFDVAILDVNLDGQRSYPVAKALNDRGVPFAFSTGYGGHGADAGFGNGSVLSKPYDYLQLVKVLTELLQAAAGNGSPALPA